MEAHPGARLAGRYDLVERIGAGGMGQVWRATDTVLDRDVAIKLLDVTSGADASAEARFALEARATAALNSPHVVTVHDSGVEDDTAYLVMELLPGPSLADELVGGPLPVTDVEEVARNVLAGLGVAHERGLVHRDIKPANVVRAADGNWRVVDFGISRLVDAGGGPTQALTATHMIVGTADYLAPEQALGHPVDGRTDLYAVGLLLWTLLAGHAPLSATTPIATMMRHANEDVPDIRAERPDVPPALAALVSRLTERDPAQRPATAAAALALLDSTAAAGVSSAAATEVLPAAGGATAILPVSPPPVSPRSTPDPPTSPSGTGWSPEAERRDRRWGPILVGVILAVVLGALLWNWAANHDWGTPASGGASVSAPATAAPSEAPSVTPSLTPSTTPSPSPSPSTPSPSPSVSPSAAVAQAMDAFSSALSSAEQDGDIDKDAAKTLAAAAREMDKAVRSGSSSNAESEIGKLRTAYDDAVSSGAIKPAAKDDLDPLLRAVEKSVADWAATQ